MQKFLEAVSKYDPEYTTKVKEVVDRIDHEFPKYKQVRAVDINRHLDYDCDRYLRLLSRRGFLSAVKGKDGKIAGWERSPLWPPPVEFFQSGAIGFTYYVQTWFQYYLQQFIESRLREVEAREGVYSYGFINGQIGRGNYLRLGNVDGSFIKAGDEQVLEPHDRHTHTGLADRRLVNQPLDICKLNISWVDGNSHRAAQYAG